jgi:hypothetical protein
VEFELDIREDQSVWMVAGILAIALLLFGLGKIGQPLTPYEEGVARVMNLADWQLIQAEEIYDAEIEVLRVDVDSLATALEAKSDPVRVSLLVKKISTDVADGTPALATARQALYQASLDVGDWSTGVLDRERAIASLQIAIALLQ